MWPYLYCPRFESFDSCLKPKILRIKKTSTMILMTYVTDADWDKANKAPCKRFFIFLNLSFNVTKCTVNRSICLDKTHAFMHESRNTSTEQNTAVLMSKIYLASIMWIFITNLYSFRVCVKKDFMICNWNHFDMKMKFCVEIICEIKSFYVIF